MLDLVMGPREPLPVMSPPDLSMRLKSLTNPHCLQCPRRLEEARPWPPPSLALLERTLPLPAVRVGNMVLNIAESIHHESGHVKFLFISGNPHAQDNSRVLLPFVDAQALQLMQIQRKQKSRPEEDGRKL